MRFPWIGSICVVFFTGAQVCGRPAVIPYQRYMDARSQALAGVTLPIDSEIGGQLFNHPGALSKSKRLRFELLNLNLEMTSASIGGLGFSSLSSTSLSGLKPELASHPEQVFGQGYSIFSGASFMGFGAGILVSDRRQAALGRDGNIHVHVDKAIAPVLGYGLDLAGGIIRLGYSLQWQNLTFGEKKIDQNSTGLNYTSSIPSRSGLGHTASFNFNFPFHYRPSLYLVARNTGIRSGFVFDSAFTFETAFIGRSVNHWYVQLYDMTSTTGVPVYERLAFGLDFDFGRVFQIRTGLTGFLNPSAGIGITTRENSFSLTYAQEKNPLDVGRSFDSRFLVQYTVRLGSKPARDRSAERKASLGGER